jgi:hypothetical protein
VANDPLDRADPTGEDSASADWLGQTQAMGNAMDNGPLSPSERADAEEFIGGFIPGISEGLATRDFIDNPSWLNAGILILSAADLGGVAKTLSRELKAEVEDEGIIYERINRADPAEKPYIRRTQSEARYAARQREHGRANPHADYEFREIARAKRGQALREAEQREIDRRGGPTNSSNPNGGTSNKRNEIAPIVRICYGSVCD